MLTASSICDTSVSGARVSAVAKNAFMSNPIGASLLVGITFGGEAAGEATGDKAAGGAVSLSGLLAMATAAAGARGATRARSAPDDASSLFTDRTGLWFVDVVVGRTC